jgi:thiamine biosynthesis lipoprotein
MMSKKGRKRMHTTSVVNVPRRRAAVLPGLKNVIIGILTGCCLFFLTVAARPGFTEGAGGAPLIRFQYSQLHMGVEVRLVVYAEDEAKSAAACSAAFQRIAALEDIMSDYRKTSELMRMCAHAGGPPVAVSKDLFIVLERAQQLARRTEGAFDVTVGPYVALWRQARRTSTLPSPEELRRAGAAVGWRKLRLDPRRRRVQLLAPGMRLDLGGIAKGYAGDEVIATLRRHGITRALVEAGGDIVVSRPPPGQKGWRVDLPTSRQPRSQPRTLTLAHAAISTSGDTEQFVEIDGRRYSHVVDPRTGLGLTHRLMATVVARDGITADSLSTAVTVLGPERGKALVQSVPGARFFIHRSTNDPLTVPLQAGASSGQRQP